MRWNKGEEMQRSLMSPIKRDMLVRQMQISNHFQQSLMLNMLPCTIFSCQHFALQCLADVIVDPKPWLLPRIASFAFWLSWPMLNHSIFELPTLVWRRQVARLSFELYWVLLPLFLHLNSSIFELTDNNNNKKVHSCHSSQKLMRLFWICLGLLVSIVHSTMGIRSDIVWKTSASIPVMGGWCIISLFLVLRVILWWLKPLHLLRR